MSFVPGDSVCKKGFFSSQEGVVVKRLGEDGILVRLSDGSVRAFKNDELESV